MKKIILASLLVLLGSSVYAADACIPGGARQLVPGSATSFIREGFNPVCSSNTTMVYTDDAANQKLIGGSASIKGSTSFAGSTLGGAVKSAVDCTNKSCGGTQAATQAAAAMVIASGLGT